MNNEILSKQWLYLYALAFESALGGYLAGFLYYYNKINIHSGGSFQNQYYDTFILFAGIATLIMAPLIILTFLLKKEQTLPQWFQKVRINAYYFLLTIALIYILYFLHKQQIHLKFVELFLAFGMSFLFYFFQKYVVEFGLPAWQNIFTTLNFGIGLVKFMVAGWVFVFHVYDIEWWVTGLLLFELLTILARFKVLNMIRPETRQTVRMMLVNYGFVFGARLIIGLFIPIGFCLFQVLTKENVLPLCALLIVIGELMERYIFIFSAIPEYYENGY